MKFTHKTELQEAKTNGSGKVYHIVRYSDQKSIKDWFQKNYLDRKPDPLITWMVVSEDLWGDFKVDTVFHRGDIASLRSWNFKFCGWIELP